MTALVLTLVPAYALDFRFVAGEEDYEFFYPTAYKDHDGVDWNCGSIRYDGHDGSDFGVGSWSGMDAGRDLVAAATGTVITAHDGEFDQCSTGDCEGGDGFGNYVSIRHPDGKKTYYGHMRQWTVAVAEGDVVECGTYLGQVGSSGHSTGPHVHFAVKSADDDWQDPFWGDCSGAPSFWTDQGAYDGLPGTDCDAVPACEPVTRLSCGDSLATSNDGPGSTSEHGAYGCVDYGYSGPELVYEVVTDTSEPVTVSLTGLSSDLDLFAMEGTACDTSGCLASSSEGDRTDESVTWDAVAGHVYAVAVDGWEGAVSPLTLSVSCTGSMPAVVDTADTGVESEEPKGTRTLAEEGGCGCGASPASGLPGVLLALFGLRRRD